MIPTRFKASELCHCMSSVNFFVGRYSRIEESLRYSEVFANL